jgi:hypothetical protein
MAEIKSGVTLSLKDLFSQGMNKAAGAASGFAGKTLGAIEKVDKAVSGTTAKLAALGLTFSVGAAAKGVIEMDHRMTRLGLSVNASADRISKMKRAIFDVAQASDVKIDPTNILSGIEVVISKTSDLKYAEDNIRNIALAMQATGESGESMGALFSEFRKFEYSTEQISSLMDDMVAQANQGAFSLADFAKTAPQIFSVLEAKKIGAMPENIKSVNAALQIINAGAKNSTKTFAAFNSVFEEITDPSKQKDLRKLVNVKDSNGKLKDFNDIMFEIAEKAKDPRNANILNRIFNSSSMLAINSYVSHGEKMKDTLLDLGDTTGLLQKQSAAMAGTMQSNIKNLQTAFNSFADSNLTKPLAGLTELLNKLSEDPERLKKVFTGIAVGIGAIAAVKGIAGISRLVGSLMQLKGGKVNISESLNMAAAMPVYVTNWGGGAGVPGIGAGGQFQQPPVSQVPAPQLSNKPLTAAQNALKNITPQQYAGAAGGMALTAAFVKIPQMMSELDAIKQNEELTAKERGKAKGGAIGDASGSIVGAAAGGAAGIAAGAAVGAAVGSVVPILGTAVGALVGAGIGALGMYLGGKAGRKIGEGIGVSLASDDSETQSQTTEKSDWRDSPAQKRYQQRYRRVPVSDLPPQITQTSSSVKPQKVELGGQAVMDVNVNLSGVSPTASVSIRDNSTNFRFNPGSTAQARMVP